MEYSALLNDMIKDEKSGRIFAVSNHDKGVFEDLLREINLLCGREFHYFSELECFHVEGAGEITKKYVKQFASEMPKALLLRQMYYDKLEGCDEFILGLYNDFRNTAEYLPEPGKPTSAYIYLQYDNAFEKMKSKRIENSLVELLMNPLDASNLPLTLKMLASKQIEEIKKILVCHITEDYKPSDFGMKEENAEDYRPSFHNRKEEMKYLALVALKYFRGNDVLEVLKDTIDGENKGFSKTAEKTYNYIMKRS